MTWTELEQPIEGMLGEVFACRFQFFIGKASDKSPYLQFVVFGDVKSRATPNAYLLPRVGKVRWLFLIPLELFRFTYHKVNFDFSEVKKQQWLTKGDGSRILVSTTFAVRDGREVTTGVDCTKFTGKRVRLLPTIWKNDYNLREELRDSSAVSEHFPAGVEEI